MVCTVCSSPLATACRRGERFLSSEFVDEFGRLSVINTTASQARAAIAGLRFDSVDTWSSVRELVGAATQEAISRARLLVEAATNTATPSLSEPSKTKIFIEGCFT